MATVSVIKVSLNKSTLTLDVGASETLTSTVAPANATEKRITLTSDKTDIASVDADGKVIAVKARTDNITVNVKTVSCAETVNATTINAPGAPITGIVAPVTSTTPSTAVNHGESYSAMLNGWADEDADG